MLALKSHEGDLTSRSTTLTAALECFEKYGPSLPDGFSFEVSIAITDAFSRISGILAKDASERQPKRNSRTSKCSSRRAPASSPWTRASIA